MILITRSIRSPMSLAITRHPPPLSPPWQPSPLPPTPPPHPASISLTVAAMPPLVSTTPQLLSTIYTILTITTATLAVSTQRGVWCSYQIRVLLVMVSPAWVRWFGFLHQRVRVVLITTTAGAFWFSGQHHRPPIRVRVVLDHHKDAVGLYRNTAM
nr:hypothetical protein [Tanacetum cinerariifolium]